MSAIDIPFSDSTESPTPSILDAIRAAFATWLISYLDWEQQSGSLRRVLVYWMVEFEGKLYNVSEATLLLALISHKIVA